MASTIVETPKKTIGTTTLSGAGGSVIGVALASIVLYFFHQDARDALFLPVGVVASAVCAIVGGYLAPSKAEALAPYLSAASVDIANQVAAQVPSPPTADEVAESVAAKVTDPAPTYTGAHAGQDASTDSVPMSEPGPVEEYPDITTMARN